MRQPTTTPGSAPVSRARTTAKSQGALKPLKVEKLQDWLASSSLADAAIVGQLGGGGELYLKNNKGLFRVTKSGDETILRQVPRSAINAVVNSTDYHINSADLLESYFKAKGITSGDVAAKLACLREIEAALVAEAGVAPQNFAAASEVATKPSSTKGTQAAALPPGAQELFGDLPPSLKLQRTKSDFPKEWLDDPEVVRAARRLLNARNRHKGVQLEPADAERVRAAARFVRAYDRRHAGSAKPG